MTQENNNHTEVNETQNAILMAAKKEFADKGYSGARINAIAKRAGVNQALVHYYFKSKEGLYRALMEILLGIDQSPVILTFMEKYDLEPPERLYLIIYMLVHLHENTTDSDTNRIMAREVAENRQWVNHLFSEKIIPRLLLLEKVIKDGIKTGNFETPNSLLSVIHFIQMIISYSSQRDIYRKTGLYQKLYESITIADFCSYMITTTFKSLTPLGRKVTIPALPDHILEEALADIKSVERRLPS